MSLVSYFKGKGSGKDGKDTKKDASNGPSSSNTMFGIVPTAPPMYTVEDELSIWEMVKKIEVNVEVRSSKDQSVSPFSIKQLIEPLVDEYDGPDGLYWPTLAFVMVGITNSMEIKGTGATYYIYKQSFNSAFKLRFKGTKFEVKDNFACNGSYVLNRGGCRTTVRYNIRYKDTKMVGVNAFNLKENDEGIPPLTRSELDALKSQGMTLFFQNDILVFPGTGAKSLSA